jgi:hypothetical protein
MNAFIVFSILLILFGLGFGLIYNTLFTSSTFVNYIAPYAPKSQSNWWNRSGWERFGYPYYSYWEAFTNHNSPAQFNKKDNGKNNGKNNSKDNDQNLTVNNILEYPPDSPAPANVHNNNPYHLLNDIISKPRDTEALSCVNSRSCYATDFERIISKTGNYRQLTNNYKRGYPDSCSAPYQELVLNFYKADSIPVPS